MSQTILPLDTSSIHKLKSGQVIVDLQSAVKELVENSLDAGATSIGAVDFHHIAAWKLIPETEVRFKEYGLKSIEVVDNGCGIAVGDHDAIGMRLFLRISRLIVVLSAQCTHVEN
jgi:DNA mismatch repair protein PMS2